MRQDAFDHSALAKALLSAASSGGGYSARALLRDSKAPGLRVRVTTAGANSFVFEKKLNRQTIRRTIGDVRAWSIDAARVEAARLTVMFNIGTDPCELERQQDETKAAQLAETAAKIDTNKLAALTVGEVWNTYIVERRPHWGDLHYRDHIDATIIRPLGMAPADRVSDLVRRASSLYHFGQDLCPEPCPTRYGPERGAYFQPGMSLKC